VSSEPGKGTTFRVLLPAIQGAAESLAEDSEQAGLGRWTGTVLVVDDEQVVRAVAKRMLERLGFRVVLAADGLEAVSLFSRTESEAPAKIIFVLLDMTMPRMDGTETFRELRKRRADVPILFASGYDEREFERRFEGSSAVAFIQKPYQMGPLERKIREIMQV